MVTLLLGSVIVNVIISVEVSLTQYIVEPSTSAVPEVGQVPVHDSPNMLSTNCLDKFAYILDSTFLINLFMVVLFSNLVAAAAADLAASLISFGL